MAADAAPSRPRHWWRETVTGLGIRGVFHALCRLDPGEDATEVLDFATGQDWMRELADRSGRLAVLSRTAPVDPGDVDQVRSLELLYAAGRVRDVLLLGHQPDPAGDEVPELDEALGREQPRFRPVPADQIAAFFASIGARAETGLSFDPILHEIVSCLHWEYWRRHRPTQDGSFWWGSNSQWRTEIRRDYITDRGNVYNFDASSDWHKRMNETIAGIARIPAPTPDLAAELVKNRCLLRDADGEQFRWPDHIVDERRAG